MRVITVRDVQLLRVNVNGLMGVFSMALPSRLLYRFERPQYAELFQNRPHDSQLDPAHLYGAEFLVRLFGRDRTL